MITINEQKIVAETQTYRVTSVLLEFNNEFNCKKRATINYEILNENDIVIEQNNIVYADAEYDDFWNSFNSGKFLYEELKAKKELDVEIPDEIEAEFTNE